MMIPPRYVEELKNAPDDEVDFVGTFFEVCHFVIARHAISH